MTLLDEYNNGVNGEFQAKICAALCKEATVQLLLLDGTEPNYAAMIQFIDTDLGSDGSSCKYIARAMASVGLTNASTDLQIQNAITTNFEKLAALKDPAVWAKLLSA